MKTLTVSVQMPADILSVLNIPQIELSGRLRELVVIELFREEKISAGKGAEILDISKWDFVQLLAKYDIDYFTLKPDELAEEIRVVEQLIHTETT